MFYQIKRIELPFSKTRLSVVLQIDVFVLVTCPEACLENEKEYMQPVVTLLEMELALNPNRQWNDKLSVDFRDLLEGGGEWI